MATPRSLLRPVEDRRFLGIGLLIIAVGLFACLDTTAKYLVVNGMHPFQVAFVRHLVTLVIMLGAFAPAHGGALFASNNLKLEIARGLIMAVGTLLNFAALMFLPLTVMASILFTMPLIVTGLSVPLLGEKVGWRRWVAIVIGFVGVLIVIRPGGASFHPAVFFAIAAALLFAVLNILNRKLAGVDSVPTQQIYAALISVACLAPGAAWQWSMPTGGAVWLLLILVGVIGTVGHFIATVAHRYAGASTLAPFFYPHIIFASILSWLVFDQTPDIYMIVGAIIVVGAGLYVWQRERSKVDAAAASVPPVS